MSGTTSVNGAPRANPSFHPTCRKQDSPACGHRLAPTLALTKMLLDALPAMLLVALAAFILWEGWRRRRGAPKQLSRAALERGFVPGATATEQMFFVGAAVLLVFSAVLFVSPSHPPFTGRGAVFSSLVYGVLSPIGASVAVAAIGVACFALSLSARRRRLGAQRES